MARSEGAIRLYLGQMAGIEYRRMHGSDHPRPSLTRRRFLGMVTALIVR
jgi:hypothetical protein